MNETPPVEPTPAPPNDPAIRVNRSVAVLLRRDGVLLPRAGQKPETKLNLAGLELVAALAVDEPVSPRSVVQPLVARHGIEPMGLRIVIRQLRERGFVSTEPAPPRAVAAPLVGELSAPAGGPGQLPDEESLVVGSPRLLRVEAGMFELLDHDGGLVARLSPVELAAVAALSSEATVAAAVAVHQAQAKDAALDRAAIDALASRMLDAHVLERASECRANAREQAMMDRSWGRAMRAREALRRHFVEAGARAEELAASSGHPRVPVIPVHTQFTTPLSLGMLVAYALQHDGGRLLDDYAFMPAVLIEPGLPTLTLSDEDLAPFIDKGSVFLFSNYVWSHGTNLDTSRRIKERNPRAITIHGGPDTPKYDGDVEAYFAANPFVDIVVHGEGEATFSDLLSALAPVVHDDERDLSVLSKVPGLSYRTADGVARTEARDRIADVNEIPSPYLTGVYEAYRDGAIDTAMIETNRGCPYSCTFCDWGSSTASRIRKFDLDRVFGELEWCARNGVSRIFFCDANFGIFERDVEIAQKVADLRKEFGYPQALTTNYAKNTVKHLQKIVQIMAEAGVVTEGLLSLQSMDDDTLSTIRRNNIKVEKYDALAAEFREAELPLLVDLMIGLPGSTTRSVREDFQECIDREVNAKVFQTELLVNSPMNEPSYRQEHQIRTERTDGRPSERIPMLGSTGAGRALVVSSSSFTREDYDEMLQLRAVFRLVENFAVLRIVARYLRQTTGVREGDFIEALRATAHAEPDRWPRLSLAMRVVPEHMVPPVSWRPFIDEMRAYLVGELGVPEGSGLDAVLAVQHAVLPSLGRSFPQVIELPHDVGAWYRDVLRAKDEGHRTTWPEHVAPLETYDPTSFKIDDPDGLCEVGLGFGIDTDPYASWELHSPVARHLAGHHTVLS